jgi:hypothetical protein
MSLSTRFAAVALTAAVLAVPITAHADSPNAGGAVTHTTGSQLMAHFMTVDSSGCIRNDLFIHGVAGSPAAIDANVESANLCTGSLILLTGGTNWNSTVQVDDALQAAHASGTIMTYDRNTGTPLAVSIDLDLAGYGPLSTTPIAPGLAPLGNTGFHVTTPYVNVTYNGVLSSRAATASGSIGIPGFSFPLSSAQTDLTLLSSGSSDFIVTLKP